MSVEICIANTDEERAKVFRFRYKVFVQELNLFHDSADHDDGREHTAA